MMLECIVFLTEGCFHNITNGDSSYTIECTNKKSTPPLLKILMTKSIIDTPSSTYQLRNQLDSLEEYMFSVNSNIELFNMHVKRTIEGLRARGKTIDDLALKFLKGCKVLLDSKFVECIDEKEEFYLNSDTIKDDTLIQLALNKDDIRVIIITEDPQAQSKRKLLRFQQN